MRGFKQYLQNRYWKLAVASAGLFFIAYVLLLEVLRVNPWSNVVLSGASTLLGVFFLEKFSQITTQQAGLPKLVIFLKRALLTSALFVLVYGLLDLALDLGWLLTLLVAVSAVYIVHLTYFQKGWNHPRLSYRKSDEDWMVIYIGILVVAAILVVVSIWAKLPLLDPDLRKELFVLLGEISWPVVVAVLLVLLRKQLSYLFLEVEELNLFGIKGKFKSGKDVIRDRAEQLFREWKIREKPPEFEERMKKIQEENKDNDAAVAQFRVVAEQQFDKRRELQKEVFVLTARAEMAEKSVALYEHVFGVSSNGKSRVAEVSRIDPSPDEGQGGEEPNE